MVPVDKVDELGIRAIVSAEEAQKAIDMMAEEVEPITSRPRQPGRNGSRCRLAPLKAGSVEGWLSMAKMRVERTFLQSGEGEESRPQKSAKLPSSSLQLGCPWEMREASAGTQEAPRHGRGPL